MLYFDESEDVAIITNSDQDFRMVHGTRILPEHRPECERQVEQALQAGGYTAAVSALVDFNREYARGERTWHKYCEEIGL